MKAFNINNTVKVRLTDFGRKILKDRYVECFSKNGLLEKYPYTPLKEDEDGYVNMQMHEIMKYFGEYMVQGGRMVQGDREEKYPLRFNVLLDEGDLKTLKMIPERIKIGNHYNFTIDRIINDDFKIPDFQRPLVWTRQQKIKLIESLWLGIPIGTYIINESDNPTLNNIIIDGQQRINAIKEYVSDCFAVFDLLYSELSKPQEKRFANTLFPCYVTESDDIEYIKNYYNLMNFGGTAHKESQKA